MEETRQFRSFLKVDLGFNLFNISARSDCSTGRVDAFLFSDCLSPFFLINFFIVLFPSLIKYYQIMFIIIVF